MKKDGFTLIELMIVVAIIGILAAIGLTKFNELVKRADEGSTKGKLGGLRSSLSIYYSDMAGVFPNEPASLTIAGRYIAQIPKASVPGFHGDNASFTLGAISDDAGGWLYNNVAGHSLFGTMFVNCSHTDSKGTVWTEY